MKYNVVVFGCQMNISDAERVSAVLESIKYKKTSDINEADLIVVVMCSVRQSAVNRIHGLVQKFKQIRKTNPELKTFLTGCVLKRDKKMFAEEFDFVISEPVDLKRILPASVSEGSLPSVRTNKFSAYMPIMTGCNNFCAYCVVPYTRGREISRPAKEILQEIRNLTNPTSPRLRGAKEIWLLGQNVNSYKDPSAGSGQVVNFPELLKMANNIPGEFWIRFTSSHPKDFNDEVIDALAIGKKITPYLNLPIQSGDDKILKLMNRHYTVKDYKSKIAKLRKKIPGISISTDIIVGFPGETKKQFENTVKLFRDVKYDMAYINKYSPRPGTAAAKLKDNVSIIEKKRREKVLTEVLKKTALLQNRKLVGKETTVLFNEMRPARRSLGEGGGDNWFGKNEQYKTIKIKSAKSLLGKLLKVKITKVSPFTLEGELIHE
jgi:tRNA-2-methylthio-N6-dimethylallyladenosine synthase